MSIFGAQSTATIPTAETGAERWWNWNPARRKPAPAPVVTAEPTPWWSWNPYRTTVNHAASQGRREGYSQGVRDEQRIVQRRRKRRSHPILALVFLAAAACGVGFVGLAFDTGSFASGGAVVDQKIGEWRSDLVDAAAGRSAQQPAPTPSSAQSGG